MVQGLEMVNSNSIVDELEYERALIADRKLRILAKENTHFKKIRLKLRDLIEKYENSEWNDFDRITEEKLAESSKHEQIAEFERIFLETRKQEIRKNSNILI